MIRPRSIRARLSLVFALFLLLVVGVGLFGINRISILNEASAEIRGHWLRAAPILGELNNLISDARAAEAASLIANETADAVTQRAELAALELALRKTRLAYEQTYQDASEKALYSRFLAQWDTYRRAADQVLAQVTDGRRLDAIELFRTGSHEAFIAASNTLAAMVQHNVDGARLSTEREADVYRMSRNLILGAILLAAIFLVTAIMFITRSISDPLLDLAQRMHRLAANETGVAVEGAARADEIGEMARAVLVFRDNAVKLIESRQALSEQTATLREALDAERRLTTQQQNFVSMTSHEFRTPLTIIDSHAQRLIRMKDRLEPEQLAVRARGIRGAVTRMTNLMDSLFNTSRVFDGDVRLQRAQVDLVLLSRQACQMHRELAPNAQLRESYGEPVIEITGDPRLLFQMISNLLSNAIKYSPPASPVEIAVTAIGADARITVSDRGIGIPMKDRGHLFERYFRGSNVSDIAGTGVGLYLVDMVASLHGGRACIDPDVMQGSRFSVVLPLKQPAAAAALATQPA